MLLFEQLKVSVVPKNKREPICKYCQKKLRAGDPVFKYQSKHPHTQKIQKHWYLTPQFRRELLCPRCAKRLKDGEIQIVWNFMMN